jgi:very-short-patch-repair endonuclease
MDLTSLARDGVFSTADARVLGLGTRQLQTLAGRGECTPLTRGWWAAGAIPTGMPRHLLTIAALRRHFAGRAWVSHYSALALKGLPIDGADLSRVHLTRTRDQQSRRQPGFTLHRAVVVAPDELSRLAVAIVQTGTVTSALTALCAADAALHRGLVTSEALRHALTTLRLHPGTAATRALLVHADSRHESPGETRTAVVLRHLDVRATPQVAIARDGIRYRVDFLVDGAPVVIEFDGRVKYGSGDDVFAEKLREDRLRSWGYEVVRLTWADLDRPTRVAELIAAAVGRSRRRAG